MFTFLFILYLLALLSFGVWLFVDFPYWVVFGKHVWQDESWKGKK